MTCFPLIEAVVAHPGVLQVEAMAQLGGIVMMDPDSKAAQNNFFFGGIEGCKFRRPVVPGDTLVNPTNAWMSCLIAIQYVSRCFLDVRGSLGTCAVPCDTCIRI